MDDMTLTIAYCIISNVCRHVPCSFVKFFLLYCFPLVLHFKFVPHTIIHSLLKFYCMHVNVIFYY